MGRTAQDKEKSMMRESEGWTCAWAIDKNQKAKEQQLRPSSTLLLSLLKRIRILAASWSSGSWNAETGFMAHYSALAAPVKDRDQSISLKNNYLLSKFSSLRV